MTNSPISELDWIAGNTIIQFTYTDPALLPVDAVVEEQDTNLVLGKSPVVMNTIESFPALVKRMEQQTMQIPGNLIVKASGKPKRFVAIVYDIDHSPICEMEWIEEVFCDILLQCEKFRIKTLAMPLLGTSYGKLDGTKIMTLLQNLLISNRHQYLKKILIYKAPDN